MPNTSADPLLRLIQCMTKAEKRNFKLSAATADVKTGSGTKETDDACVEPDRTGRTAPKTDDALYVQLFDALDKMRDYDEELIFKKVPAIKRSQLSNLKRHLYRQILTSLRRLHIAKNPDIEIREQIDFARVLYVKGLYHQSLRVLERAGELAREARLNLLALEIVEFEKTIELRHITRSIDNRAELLTESSGQLAQQVKQGERLLGLALKLYGFYIKAGHVKSERDAFILTEFFHSNLPDVQYHRLGFWEKVNYCKSYMWYYYILQNFVYYYKYAQKWVDLYEEAPEMKRYDSDLYLRGLHNLLISYFFTAQYDKFVVALTELSDFIEQEKSHFNTNDEVQAFVYLYSAKINKHFMEGSFTAGLALVPELQTHINRFGPYLDLHRTMVFYYKIASLYFGSGDMGNAIDYLNKVIHANAGSLREDIQCYARILHLIAHYELRHYDLLEYLAKSVYRFLAKMEDLNAVQQEILRFLRQELHSNPNNLNRAFRQLHARLLKLRELPYERRSFLYLDIISWLESKIEGVRTTEMVISGKFRGTADPRSASNAQ